MRFFFLFCMIFYIMNCSPNPRKPEPEASSDPVYTLVWSDDFEQDGVPDTSNWTYENGFVRNLEIQWYQPENAFCKIPFQV